MNTIFESSARQPSEASVERELDVLKEEIEVRQKEKNTITAKHINFEDDRAIKNLCAQEAISVTLGDRFGTNKNKVTAVAFKVGIMEQDIKVVCAEFKLQRSNYYSGTSRGLDLSQKSLINTMTERYLQLYKYFTVTIHQLIEHPVTITIKSKV